MTTEVATTSWHSYPSIFSMGHRALADLLTQPVLVEEKVDGSQFSFGRFGGELKCRSKGAQLQVLAPDKMFERGVAEVGSLDLHDGWTYRGEYLMKPKHNALVYDRVPAHNVILFDINTGHEEYMSAADKKAEADRLGLETVPALFLGMLTDIGLLRTLLADTSVLGGQLIEGVVVKSLSLYGVDKKLLMGKFVSESFKEVHAGEWKQANPGGKDLVHELADKLTTPARWQKAVQHMREAGTLTDSPRDIGPLIKEIQQDVMREEGEMIRDKLFQWAKQDIERAVVRGAAEWYKERLLEQQFSV